MAHGIVIRRLLNIRFVVNRYVTLATAVGSGQDQRRSLGNIEWELQMAWVACFIIRPFQVQQHTQWCHTRRHTRLKNRQREAWWHGFNDKRLCLLYKTLYNSLDCVCVCDGEVGGGLGRKWELRWPRSGFVMSNREYRHTWRAFTNFPGLECTKARWINIQAHRWGHATASSSENR